MAGQTEEQVRVSYLREVVGWLTSQPTTPPAPRLLDYGCGDLLLGRLLPDGWIVDGFDTDPEKRRAAEQTASALGRGVVFDEEAAIPAGAYDGIVCNSVVQYFAGEEELGVLLESAARWIRRDASLGLLITDLPAGRHHRARDGIDLLRFMAAVVGPVRALGAAWALRGGARRELFTLSSTRAGLLAARREWTALPLHRNLTPLRGRRTYHLVRRAEQDRDLGPGLGVPSPDDAATSGPEDDRPRT